LERKSLYNAHLEPTKTNRGKKNNEAPLNNRKKGTLGFSTEKNERKGENSRKKRTRPIGVSEVSENQGNIRKRPGKRQERNQVSSNFPTEIKGGESREKTTS